MVTSPLLPARFGAAALAAAGVLFVLYPAARPWDDETTVEGAISAMGSSAWVASHLFGSFGFVLVGVGMLALAGLLGSTPMAKQAARALLATWLGVGLLLPFYGAETFGLHAMARGAADGAEFDLLGMVDDFREHPAAVTTFGIGLVLVAVGSVMAALAIRASGLLGRHSGIPFAVGFVLYLPQFFTPPAVRIGHGVLVGVGCAWIAVELWRGDALGGTERSAV